MMPARSGADPEAQWPPRSPHDVLLSTPKGRERLRRMAERASPSPSPSKRSRVTPILVGRSGNSRRNMADEMDIDMDEDEDEDDEEDEEMLQLKLQAIQAKLKLKKLQSAKAKKASGGDATSTRSESNPIPDISINSRAQSQAESVRPRPAPRSQSQAEIQVPVSPVRRAPAPQPDNSPSRVRLGIDKGIKAKDVSLKRAPSLRKTTENNNGSQGGGYLRRAHTPAFSNGEQSTQQQRPMTFSERMAAARTDEQSRQEKRERIKQVRSNAFELGRQEMEQFKSNAKDIPDVPIQPEQFSHDEVMAGSRLKRSNTMPSLRRPTQDENRSGSSLGGENDSQASQSKKTPPSEVPEEEASAFEPYSAVHLSKRVIPHPVLARNLAGKKTYVIKDLLKHVKAPEFQLPEIEQDIVVFGILASKSDPRSHKTSNNNNLKEKTQTDPAKGKYMVLQLVDLQWELELFLFNSGFDRYWKLVPGTLLAVLNPNIMPPPPGRTDTGRFSLVINSGQDTILEIGTARDLGFCKSIKKDGEPCNGWVNRKRTEFCEFHMNLGLAKHRQARQDVNAFNTGLGPRKDGGGRNYKNSYRLHDWEAHANDPKKKGRGNFDRGNGGQWFINKPSAASMLDNDIVGGRVADTMERGEALRRRLATEEKERELMKTLGKIGSGAGKEYMQKRGVAGANKNSGGGTSTPGSLGFGVPGSMDDQPRQDADARALGLVRPKGSEPKMHLSPVKRKRSDNSSFGVGSSFPGAGSGTGSKPALGWGGGLRDKLSRMKEGERLRPATSFSNSSALGEKDVSGTDDGGGRSSSMRPPARKKTRFVTEKGIREAGRESLGGELGSGEGDASTNTDINTNANSGGSKPKQRRMVVLDEDDDDELEILR
ncbi:hypothetical protein F4805DRAFT_425453 [Annulohypoxylon moriforme]|nr:hypothetical protein F4805DRAFT_425453 [Annulohypoxylon moriforme]